MWYFKYFTGNGEKATIPLPVKKDQMFKNLAKIEASKLFLKIKEEDKNAKDPEYFWRIEEVFELKLE